MEEITQEQKDYIRSFRLWVESQKLNLEEVENELEHSLRRLDLERKQADLFKLRIDNNIAYTDSCIKSFTDWCDENGIDKDVEIDNLIN